MNSIFPSPDTYALGVDLGTSGVRVALVDAYGHPAAFAESRFRYAQDMQRPEAWWLGVVNGVQQLSGLKLMKSVAAIAVAGTSGTVLAVNYDGEPLANASLYNQQGSDGALERVRDVAPADNVAVAPTSALARIKDLAASFPGARIVHQADWITERLTQRHAVSDETNALKTGYDPVKRCWPSWIAHCGFDHRCLPPVVAVGTPIQRISPIIAKLLGLSDAVMVFAGTTDGCAAFLATGANKTGDAVTSLGSTLVLKVLSGEPVFAPEFGVYSHRLGDHWLTGGASNAGSSALLSHFSVETMKKLEGELVPERSTGLQYYPLVSIGERFPVADPLKAPVLAPRPTDDATFFQALLESLAAIEHAGYSRLKACGAPWPFTLRSVGGGASSEPFTKIRMRVLGIPMHESRSMQAAVGAAYVALAGLTGRDVIGNQTQPS